MVGETGFAPARASAHEFLRLACIRSTTRRKTCAAGATCTPTRRSGAAVFKTARSTFPRTAANGRGGRIRTGTGHHAQRVLSPPCLHSNHAAIKWCGQRESHPQGLSSIGSSGRRVYCLFASLPRGHPLSSPARCARGYAISALRATSPRPQTLEHPQGRAPCSLPYQGSPSLSTGWMQSGRSGRTRTFVAPEGNAVTARRNCCSATLRNMGARAGFAPATFSL